MIFFLSVLIIVFPVIPSLGVFVCVFVNAINLTGTAAEDVLVWAHLLG